MIYKETKTYKFFHRFLIQHLSIHVNILRRLTPKAGNFCSILELQLVLRLTDGRCNQGFANFYYQLEQKSQGIFQKVIQYPYHGLKGTLLRAQLL